MKSPTTTSTHDRKVFRVGTLTYTKAALFSLFAWLLWGDFCFVLMEAAAPAVLQVNLNEMGAPNWVLGLALSTIPGILNMTINPTSSFWSDRFRSRWGRRIPFLFLATIPLAFFLMLLGFSRQIGALLHGALNGGFSQATVIIAVFLVLVFCFQIFHMVVASVYYYLFNDVVPAEVLARFMSIFRIVGVLSGAVFNWFFLKYAVSHMTEVFLLAAGLYATAFLLMCWKVKEGEYPPPPVHPDGGTGLVSGIKTFFTESFSFRFYWLFFLANTCFALTSVAGSFHLLQARSIGVDLDFYGKTAAVAGIVQHLWAELLQPAVFDADALWGLSQMDLPQRAEHAGPRLLTPHVGEMLGLLPTDFLSEHLQPDALEHAAADMARAIHAVVVLKGPATFVVDPQQQIHNETGNPGMATGGTGDVLTGIAAALLGQHLQPFAAARMAVWVHGRAGDCAAAVHTERSMTATDVIAALPQAFQTVLATEA